MRDDDMTLEFTDTEKPVADVLETIFYVDLLAAVVIVIAAIKLKIYLVMKARNTVTEGETYKK
jgi:hypothetical protein